jgi:membrane-associated PAP2 superfamily phosphatase
MAHSPDQQLADALRQLARDCPADEVPTAAQVWSRSQFRLCYRSQNRGHSYAATVSTATVALYALLFLLWDTRPESLAVGLLFTLAVAIMAAFLLCWLSRRTAHS